MTAVLPPCTVPTMYFIGVTTGQSSSMKMFPEWSRILGAEAVIVGYDAPLHAPEEVYRRIVGHIKDDPLARGALVTTHKLDLLAATRDMFDYLDSYAELCEEVSSISKREGQLRGHAKDPISSGMTWQGFVPAGHFGKHGSDVLCLGAGGSALAISVYVAGLPHPADHPRKFTFVDINAARLDALKATHARLNTPVVFEYVLSDNPAHNDALMAALPPGSLVINATGMGKDRPGSPITDAGLFPLDGLVWELNYRGALDFLQQANRQAADRRLSVHDGWVYFLHGWAQVVAEVFDVALTPDLFAQLAAAGEAIRS